MLQRCNAIISTMLCCAAVFGALPPEIAVESDTGALTIDGLSARVGVFVDSWKLFSQRAEVAIPESRPLLTESNYAFQGRFKAGTSEFRFEESIAATAPGTVRVKYNLASDGTPIFCKDIVLAITLPLVDFEDGTVAVDGKPIKARNGRFGRAKKVEVFHCGRRLTFEGDFPCVSLADQRPWRSQNFSLRLGFSQRSGNVTASALDFILTIKGHGMAPLALNRAKGLRPLPRKVGHEVLKERGIKAGELRCAGILFSIAPEKMLALDGGTAGNIAFPATDAAAAGNLYLLHNAETGAVPEIEIVYSDGSTQSVTPEKGRDFSDVKPPVRLPNGAVIGCGKEFKALYFSVFPLTGEKISSVKFRNSGTGRWQVVAATVARAKVRPERVESCFITDSGADWIELEPATAPVKGSLLDLSAWNRAPAGAHGRIFVDADGHFATPDPKPERIRLVGPNLCFSANFPSREEAENLADELAARGYNAVRFHHFDTMVTRDAKTLDPENIDRLDYLFYCLKKRGIYMTVDLYCNRKLRPHELPGVQYRDGHFLKALAPILPEARQNWKDFAAALLNHVNFYTKIAWKDDPALFGVSLLNESMTFRNWKTAEPLYLDGYVKFLAARQLDTPRNRAERGELFLRYLAELEADLSCDLLDFLKNRLGYKGLVTNYNFVTNALLSPLRAQFDWVDSHSYHDHPRFAPGRKWQAPYLFRQTSALADGGSVPRNLMPARIFGKPFTVTEVNYVFPNRFRAEAGPLLGGYAALQDWDGLFRFAWAHNNDAAHHRLPVSGFDAANDPIAQISEFIITFIMRRNAVAPAPTGYAIAYRREEWRGRGDFKAGHISNEFSRLGLYCRIGTAPDGADLPGIQMLPDAADFTAALGDGAKKFQNAGVKAAETGELLLDARNKTLRLAAPEIESIAGDTGFLIGKRLKVRNATRTFQVVTAIALDGNPLPDSKKIVIFHQTDVLNRHMRFASNRQQQVDSWGENVQLLLRATAPVELELTKGETYRVSAIGRNGDVKGQVQANTVDGRLSFTADTSLYRGTLAYLVTMDE